MPASALAKNSSLYFSGRSETNKRKAGNPGIVKMGTEKKPRGLGPMIIGIAFFGAGVIKMFESLFSVYLGPFVLILLGLVLMLFATVIYRS